MPAICHHPRFTVSRCLLETPLLIGLVIEHGEPTGSEFDAQKAQMLWRAAHQFGPSNVVSIEPDDVGATAWMARIAHSESSVEPIQLEGAGQVCNFRLNFHHCGRSELDLRAHTHVRGAASSCLRLKLADLVLI